MLNKCSCTGRMARSSMINSKSSGLIYLHKECSIINYCLTKEPNYNIINFFQIWWSASLTKSPKFALATADCDDGSSHTYPFHSWWLHVSVYGTHTIWWRMWWLTMRCIWHWLLAVWTWRSCVPVLGVWVCITNVFPYNNDGFLIRTAKCGTMYLLFMLPSVWRSHVWGGGGRGTSVVEAINAIPTRMIC
jgi:hypothetical protein